MASEQTDFLSQLFGVLVPVETACFLMDDASRDQVTRWIEDGKLRAINIAVSTGSDRKRTIRVWRWSIDALLHDTVARTIERLGPPSIESLLPHNRAQLLTRETERFLCCSDEHVTNLLQAKLLTGPRYDSSRLQRIHRDSLLSFLRSREIA